MTGYGKAIAELPDKKVLVEIKTLNSKAIDISMRISPLYREKEMELRNELSKQLVRGKVDFSLWIERNDGTAEAAGTLNAALLRHYYTELKAAASEFGIPEPGDWLSTLLRLPDVLTKNEITELSKEEWQAAQTALAEAIRQLIDFRRQEGQALEARFRSNIDRIRQLLVSVGDYEKERVQRIRERISESLEKLSSVDYDQNRLEQELIYYIEKLDINEEKQRLGNHLHYFIETLESEDGQGKKLGFIAQEMGREINTLGSKSNHAEMQKIVVQMKDELEQIKEQVLNVL
jgi:uncharacterized protein (TIGR00255 family)